MNNRQNSAVMNLLAKIGHVRQRKLVWATLFRWLGRMGLTVVPYGLYVETNDYLDSAGLMNRLSRYYETKLLTPDTRDFPVLNETGIVSEIKFKTLLKQGCSCIYAERQGEMIGYCWFHPGRVMYDYLNYELKQDEAYAFGFWTAGHARWVAPGLANIVHRHLRSLGKTRIYSVTEQFNTPVKALRGKLRSALCRLYVHIGLFGKIQVNILLKDYSAL